MADKAWIAELGRKRQSEREAASEALERTRKDAEAQDLLLGPFWDAFTAECDSIVRQANVSMIGCVPLRLTRGRDRSLRLDCENHHALITLERDSMAFLVVGTLGHLPGGALAIDAGRVVGSKGETAEELADQAMRAFLEKAI